MRRTLAAAEALPGVAGGNMRVRRADGAVETATRGLVGTGVDAYLFGPPDGSPFTSRVTSWDGEGNGPLRAELTVPLGSGRLGSLTVTSRLAAAFDTEAVILLETIAHHATHAVERALREPAVVELAVSDRRPAPGLSPSRRPPGITVGAGALDF